ncbi:MAG: SSU ribosomal protein S7p (S5e) [Parcubacteria group bacterium Gr01-1014_66]|nr:MAG: SSU ribosomal protein S7p (S5e) [Parcubacteria group bacterium Gr01-1014_66]
MTSGSSMRRKRNYKREILPDTKFGNITIAKFINYIMRKGKKSVAEKIMYQTCEVLEKKFAQEPMAVFDAAMKNVGPVVEVKSRRIGGATYQVPREVRGERKFALASRWILAAARSKKGKPMHEKLAEELLAASKNEGSAIKKKQDTHRMAEANKAFAHFSW